MNSLHAQRLRMSSNILYGQSNWRQAYFRDNGCYNTTIGVHIYLETCSTMK